MRRDLLLRELRSNPKALSSRLRAEMHQLVAALSRRDWEEAAACIRTEPEGASAISSADDFSLALEPFFEAYDALRFDHQARLAEHCQITDTGDHTWRVLQVVLDPADDNLWYIEGAVDLRDGASVAGPLIVVTRIGM
jgi:hypothetical protein